MLERMATFMRAAPWLLLAWCLQGAGHATEVEFKYTTRPGDHLSKISQRYMLKDKRWQELAQHNQLPNANLIQPGIVLSIPAPWLAMRSAPAILKDYAGDVKVGHTEHGWKQASKGMPVQTGQYIRLGPNSSGRLEFADHTVLILQPNTLLQMDTLSLFGDGFMTDTKFRLQSGRIEVEANKQKQPFQSLEVITPSAVTAVRGTQFIVEANDTRTITQTKEGRVEVLNAKGSELVAEGFSTLVASGEPPTQPSTTAAAPVLDTRRNKFTQFPIQFSIGNPLKDATYVSQASADQAFSKIISEVRTGASDFAVDVFDNGKYFLRLWSVDERGIPSDTVLFPFEVDIPRQLIGRPIKIAKSSFSNGFIHLNLPKIKGSLNYMIRLTTDVQGQYGIWHLIHPENTSIQVPQPGVEADSYYF